MIIIMMSRFFGCSPEFERSAEEIMQGSAAGHARPFGCLLDHLQVLFSLKPDERQVFPYALDEQERGIGPYTPSPGHAGKHRIDLR